MSVQNLAETFTNNMITAYAEMIDMAYKMAHTQDEFDDMQKVTFERFRDMMINTCGFSPLTSANFCRLMIYLYQPDDSPFSEQNLDRIRSIIQSEIRKD